MTEDQLSRLPKFAQQEIRDLRRQRDEAIKLLSDSLDAQTPSQIFYDEMLSLSGGRQKTFYVQTHRICARSKSGFLVARIYPEDDGIKVMCDRSAIIELGAPNSFVIKDATH